MNVKYFIYAIIAISSLATSGCGVFFGDEGIFRGRSSDYLGTGNVKEITLPEGTSARKTEPAYFIPNVHSLDEFGDEIVLYEYKIPLPEAIASDKDAIGVKIQKLSGKRWIFLDAPTSRVWPRAQSFLSEYGMSTEKNNAKTGEVITDWLKFKDDNDTFSKFRVRIEKGIHPGTTEINIRQVQLDAGSKESEIVWPEVSQDPAREKWFIDQLSAELAEGLNDNTASLMGQNVGGEVKVGYALANNDPMLELRLPLARARATVAHALNKEGFLLWNDDASTGLYYAGYISPEENSGMFSWMIPDKKVDKKPKYPMSKVITHLDSSPDVKKTFAHLDSAVGYGKPLKKAKGYLVVTHLNEGKVSVVIRDHMGKRLPKAQAKAMLRIIRRNLI